MANPIPLAIPADFISFAENKGWRAIAARYGVSRETITKWRREAALSKGARPGWSAEEDAYLTAHYRTAAMPDIAEHLGRSVNAVKSRARALGIQVSTFRQHFGFTRDRKPNVSGRVQSSADMAAGFIRAHDRAAVYRTNQDGAPNPKGDHWKYGYGSLVLTEDELIAKAERKGWRADEWKRLAA